MQDDFDGGIELPDDELTGEPAHSDLAGAEAEAEGEMEAARIDRWPGFERWRTERAGGAEQGWSDPQTGREAGC